MKPLFKIGQKVTIKDICDDDKTDYPFSFVDKMQKYKNQVFEIIEIYKSISDFFKI